MNSLTAAHPWVAFSLRRTTRLLVSVFAVGSVVFFMMALVPGDPVRAALGPNAPVSLVEQRRAALGLNKPLVVQFVDYWQRLLTGNLGRSIASDRPVSQVVSERVASSAQLVGVAIVLTLLLAVGVGLVFGALTHNGRRPRTLVGFTVFS